MTRRLGMEKSISSARPSREKRSSSVIARTLRPYSASATFALKVAVWLRRTGALDDKEVLRLRNSVGARREDDLSVLHRAFIRRTHAEASFGN